MSDKELLKALGLDNRTISVTFDEDYQRIVERKVDDYLKKIEDEEKRKKDVNSLSKNMRNIKRRKNLLLCSMTLMYSEKLKTNLLWKSL